MSERIRISEYKGFELWDTPAPEGWRVHQYPVQVTCNGEHVNCFADAHEAMSVIDGMDADTIAYHMRRAPKPAPTVGGAAVDDSGYSELLDELHGRIKSLERALQPFAFCPIHPSWDDDTRCVILMNWNKPGLEVSVNEGLKLSDVRRAVDALAQARQDAGTEGK